MGLPKLPQMITRSNGDLNEIVINIDPEIDLSRYDLPPPKSNQQENVPRFLRILLLLVATVLVLICSATFLLHPSTETQAASPTHRRLGWWADRVSPWIEGCKSAPKPKPTVLYSIWATKQGGSTKNWKRRYFVLRDDKTIDYFSDYKEKHKKGSIPLAKVDPDHGVFRTVNETRGEYG